jgi:hypothetical protein
MKLEKNASFAAKLLFLRKIPPKDMPVEYGEYYHNPERGACYGA